MYKQPLDYISPTERLALQPRPEPVACRTAYFILGAILGAFLTLSACTYYL